MKRKRNLIILTAVFALLCSSIVAVKAVEKHVEQIQTIDEIVIAINSSDVNEIKWTNENGEVHFVKEDDIWKSSDDADFPVSSDSIDEFFSNFEEVHASFIIEDVEDYAQYGLSDPEHTFTFTTSDGETVVKTGSFSTMDEKRYICINDGAVYLIETDIAEVLNTSRDDYLDNDNIPYYSQVKDVEISGSNNLSIIYDEDSTHSYTKDYTYYLKDGENYSALSASKVSSLLSDFTNTTFDDYVNYKAGEEDLSGYGFDSPDLTIHISGEIYSDSDEKQEESHDLAFVKKDDETVYLHVDSSPIVYNYDTDKYAEILEATYNTLRPSEVVSVNSGEINTITGKIDSTSYKIDISTNEDGIIVYKINDEEIAADTLISYLNSLNISEFTKDVAYGTSEFEISLAFENGDVKIQFYRLDGDLCYVVVNDEEIGTMDRNSMINLKEEFTKLVLNLGKENAENSDE